MAAIQSILAKVLIQVGADEPKEIGTIEIPIDINVASRPTGITYPPGARGGSPVPGR